MKRILTSILFLSFVNLKAQNVGVNATGATPNASTILDLNTGNTYTSPNGKGILFPNVALTSTSDVTTVSSPATSLFIYNTASAGAGTTAVTPGFYYYNASKWIPFGAGSGWLTTGNYGTTAAANFMGSIDANDVVFKAGNAEVFRMGTSKTNLMVNNTANTNAYLSSTTSSTMHGIYSSVTGSTASGGNAIFAETQSTTADALVAKVINVSSGMNAITADVRGGNNNGNAIYALSSGAVSYSTIFSSNAAVTDGTAYDVTHSNHTIYGVLSGGKDYSFALYGIASNAGSLNSGGVIGYMSATQYGILGYNDANARAWGVQTPGDVLIGSTTALATNATLAYTDAALQINNSTTDKNGIYVYNSGAKSAQLPIGITAYSANSDGVYGVSYDNGGTSAGVFGESFTSGSGVIGRANIANGCGVRGTTNGTQGAGVLGYSSGTQGIGVQGLVTATAIVPATGKIGVLATANNAADYAIYAHNGTAAASSGGWAIYSDTKSGTSAGNWTTSDANLKRNIKNLDGALANVLNMRAVTYNFKPEYAIADEPQIGFISQEMQKIYPEVVSEMPLPSLEEITADGKRIPGVKRPEKALFMNYTALIPVLAEAIKEQQQQIEILKAEVEALKKAASKK